MSNHSELFSSNNIVKEVINKINSVNKEVLENHIPFINSVFTKFSSSYLDISSKLRLLKDFVTSIKETYSYNLRFLPFLRKRVVNNLINESVIFIARELCHSKELIVTIEEIYRNQKFNKNLKSSYLESIITTESIILSNNDHTTVSKNESENFYSENQNQNNDFKYNKLSANNLDDFKNDKDKDCISTISAYSSISNNNSNLNSLKFSNYNQNYNYSNSYQTSKEGNNNILVNNNNKETITTHEISNLKNAITEFIFNENITEQTAKTISEITKFSISSIEILEIFREWKLESNDNELRIDYQIEKELKKKNIPICFSETENSSFSFFVEINNSFNSPKIS